MKVVCRERFSLGLFSVEPNSVWQLEGINQNVIPQKAKIRLSECKNEGIWIEISQELFSLCFDKMEEIA